MKFDNAHKQHMIPNIRAICSIVTSFSLRFPLFTERARYCKAPFEIECHAEITQ